MMPAPPRWTANWARRSRLPLERVMKFDDIEHHVAFTDDGVVVDGAKPVAVDADYVPGQRLSMPRSTVAG